MWLYGKRCLLFLVLLFFFSVPVSAQQPSTSDRQVLIYESELSTLLSNTIKLAKLNEEQLKQLKSLKADSQAQKDQLAVLRSNLEDYWKQITNLQTELENLREILKASQVDLVNLKEQLQQAKDSYENLYESFLLYQKEVEKQINKLKADLVFTTVVAGGGWVIAVVMAILWLLEKIKIAG